MKLAMSLAALALAVPTAVGADVTTLGIGYICGAEQHQTLTASTPRSILMLPGVGNGSSPADTKSREAQAWFNEGLNLYHAFNHEEAKAAFAKGAALDPNCALCQWGLALSLGPTLNYSITPDQTATALAAADKAAKLVKPGEARAQALIAALQTRYAKFTPDGKSELAYGQAMDALVARYPADDEIANLTVQALLTPARRDDFSGVARAEAILRTVLARNPTDTAAIHYLIHATEFAGHPGEALPYAQKLAGLAPGASHLVHMAAHTLMHVGLYEKVAIVNAQALKVDADVETKMAYPGPLSAQLYYLHNYNFGIGGAMMAGDAGLAVKYADHAAVAFPAAADGSAIAAPVGAIRPMSNTPERRASAEARALAAYGRFAPDRALAAVEKPGDSRLVRIYRHYARGEAYAARRDAAAVQREADAVAALGAEASKAAETSNADLAAVAAGVLSGRSALIAGQPDKAAERFAEAAARQEKAFPFRKTFDPPPWWYPVRRSLAAADLKAGRVDDAIREANASLVDWPQDALALKVLATAEAKQGHAAAARRHLAAAHRDWRGVLNAVPIDLI